MAARSKRDGLEARSGLVVDRSAEKKMKTKLVLYVPEEYRKYLFEGEDSAVEQMARVASIEGAMQPFAGLPDMHAGKGYPVGVCCTFDADNPECRIPFEAIGGDINCGVRFWKTDVPLDVFLQKRSSIMNRLKATVPVEAQAGASSLDMKQILERGLEYLAEVGLASDRDRKGTEKRGRYGASSHKLVSQKAKAKGRAQIGTLGGGNHYLEFHYVSETYCREDAQVLGLEPGTICVSVHTGSRGLGARASFEYSARHRDIHPGPPTTPLHSPEGREYIDVVNAASNYAVCNRALIGRSIESALKENIPGCSMRFISDASHNIVERDVCGGKNVISIRKGCTKVYPPHHPCANGIFPEIGTPVYVGGSMTTGGYLIKAGPNSHRTNYSTCHGSGRIIRRKHAQENVSLEKTLAQIEKAGVFIHSSCPASLPEESEDVYKDIEKIVVFCEEEGISQRICKLLPLAVIKG